MSRKRFTLAALALAGGLFASINASAHVTWLATTHGTPSVMFGHNATNNEGYPIAKFIGVRGLKNGQAVTVASKPQSNFVTVDTSTANVVGFVLDNGYWIEAQDGTWINKPKTEAGNVKVKSSGQFVKHSVAYLNAREQPKPMGLDLEIVPAVNPATLKQGQKLSVQVLLRGKPLAGASITNDFFGNNKRVKTNAQGKAVLRIANRVFNIFEAEHTERNTDTSKADETGRSATLTFEAQHVSED